MKAGLASTPTPVVRGIRSSQDASGWPDRHPRWARRPASPMSKSDSAILVKCERYEGTANASSNAASASVHSRGASVGRFDSWENSASFGPSPFDAAGEEGVTTAFGVVSKSAACYLAQVRQSSPKVLASLGAVAVLGGALGWVLLGKSRTDRRTPPRESAPLTEPGPCPAGTLPDRGVCIPVPSP
jgi:hypothetical protein